MQARHPDVILAPLAASRSAFATPWMITLVDLISLLLTFFLMLFAMSVPIDSNWRAAADALARDLNAAPAAGGGVPLTERKPGTITFVRALDLAYLEAVIAEKIAADPLLARGRLRHGGDRLILSLPADLLFGSGSAELSHEARRAAQALAEAFQFIGNRVEVEGHADPRPVESAAFASNWELSLARAEAVAAALADAGYRRGVASFGLGDAGAVPGEFDADAWRFARRVDLVIRDRRAERRAIGGLDD